MFNVGRNAFLEMETIEAWVLLIFCWALLARIDDGNSDTTREVCLLAKARENGIETKSECVENFIIWCKRDDGAVLGCLARLLHIGLRLSTHIFLRVDVSIFVHFCLHPDAQGVHNR